MLLIEQKEPVPVKVPDVILKLSELGQIIIRVQKSHQLVVRIRIIEVILLYPTFFENINEAVSCKCLGYTVRSISLDSGKIGAKVILCASCKILKSKTVLNGDDNSATLFQVSIHHAKELLVRVVGANIPLCILKHTDKEYVVEVPWEVRLHIPEVTNMDCNVVAVLISGGIDLGTPSGKIAGHYLFCLAGQHACYSAAP